MNCKDANKKISLLIDGMLDEKRKHSLLEHIKVCSECKKLYDDMKVMVSDLSDLPEVKLPDGAENRIHFALKREAEAPKKKRWMKFTVIAAPATMALVAAVFGISYLFSGGLKNSESADMAVFEKAEIQEAEYEAKSMPAADMEAGNGAEVAVEEAAEESVEETRMLMVEEDSETVSGEAEDELYGVTVYVDAENEEEFSLIVDEVLTIVETDAQAEKVYDEETKRTTVYLPMTYRSEFISNIQTNDMKIEFIQDLDQGSDDSDLMFKVIFLFQKND